MGCVEKIEMWHTKSMRAKLFLQCYARNCVVEGAKTHYRVKHSENEFVNGRNHINGIENFWGPC